VLYTGKYSQLVLMNLKPLEGIGLETHTETDQFFRFEEGEGKVFIDGIEHAVKDGDAIIVPAGTQHNVVNPSKKRGIVVCYGDVTTCYEIKQFHEATTSNVRISHYLGFLKTLTSPLSWKMTDTQKLMTP
jgi:gentisate 1,2-dioxygenase